MDAIASRMGIHLCDCLEDGHTFILAQVRKVLKFESDNGFSKTPRGRTLYRVALVCGTTLVTTHLI